jgi:ferredoxin-NADP reductase/ferredoxin
MSKSGFFMSKYHIQLSSSDGQQLSFFCEAGDSIITAAEKENIFLVSQCQSGACGACIADCGEGKFKLADYGEDILSNEDIANRKTLLCQTYPNSDLKINLPYEYGQIRFESAKTRYATVIEKTYLTPDTIRLGLQLLADDEGNISFDFEPGQFIEIVLNDADSKIKRAYSLSNAPNWDGQLECLIKLHPQGKFSSYLDQTIAIGTQLQIEEASGKFILQDRGLRPRYFIAGGTGLAPIMSMLRQMQEWQEPHPVELFFGVWHEKDIFFQQELSDLANDMPNLKFQICVTDSVVDVFVAQLKQAKVQPDIYICGSPSLIDAVAEVTKPLGIEKEKLIYEYFLPSTLEK